MVAIRNWVAKQRPKTNEPAIWDFPNESFDDRKATSGLDISVSSWPCRRPLATSILVMGGRVGTVFQAAGMLGGGGGWCPTGGGGDETRRALSPPHARPELHGPGACPAFGGGAFMALWPATGGGRSFAPGIDAPDEVSPTCGPCRETRCDSEGGGYGGGAGSSPTQGDVVALGPPKVGCTGVAQRQGFPPLPLRLGMLPGTLRGALDGAEYAGA